MMLDTPHDCHPVQAESGVPLPPRLLWATSSTPRVRDTLGQGGAWARFGKLPPTEFAPSMHWFNNYRARYCYPGLPVRQASMPKCITSSQVARQDTRQLTSVASGQH